MDRKEIKEKAKAKLKGNLWNILWPMLVIMVLSTALSSLFGGSIINININNLEDLKDLSQAQTTTKPASTLVTLIIGIINAGYIKYILNFIRTDKFDTNSIINTIKEKWLDILIANILTTIIIFACTLLLIIPGIIMALAYSFVTYLVIDTDTKGSDALKKSREMMKGYKFDYFIFGLSFIGWFLLVIPTIGLILIWLVPYYVVANALYYENLKEKALK